MKPSSPVTISQIKARAFNALARREYATIELAKKLQTYFPDDADLIQQALQELTRDGSLSDLRHMQSFVRYTVSKGYGPRYLAHQAQLKGLNPNLMQEVLRSQEVDFREVAQQLFERRYAHKPCLTEAERAKRYRYLTGRGFDWDAIESLLKK